ncbi:hypothetical protein FALBO_8281 [Fusarium albosuccineum]|uniref:Uncharacterized protein n=1 Tax=Fusarium albosuccineum TaxID=1237068 RepID=A0A8H4P731_9HYPO|nr:hypothetical protein FALBO_8281 [Fusarium albosuccineum]
MPTTTIWSTGGQTPTPKSFAAGEIVTLFYLSGGTAGQLLTATFDGPVAAQVGGSSDITISPQTATSSASDTQPVYTQDTSSFTEDADTETTTGSAATESPSNTSKSQPEGLPDGAVAGIAIGCIILGLALGLIAAFILLRRRRHRQGEDVSQSSFSQTDKHSHRPKDDVLVAVTPSRNDVELSQFLLEATPDKQIQGELHALSELIYQHVENHYHRSNVQVDTEALAQTLVNIGYSSAASGLEAQRVAALCVDLNTRPVALRHVLSHAIFQSLDFNSRSSVSMLPPAVAEFLQTIPSTKHESTPGKKALFSPCSHSLITDADPSPATSLALSQWRTRSAMLLHPSPSERTPLPVPEAEASLQASSLANELSTVLHFFVAEVSRQDQTSHLQAVILECAKLGYVVLSQPSDWRFVFGNNDGNIRRIVVCPGLEKLSHNDGARYRSPKEVVAPVIDPLNYQMGLLPEFRGSSTPSPAVRNPLKSLRATYNLVASSGNHGQVPNEIRRSLELVRTCDKDLQHLIELRNECLPLLQRRPRILERVHSIIEAAQAGLEEVCEIVEKCRPEAHNGKTPLSSRMAWLLVNASEFRSQEPVISRHHAAVLAELNFLRQVALFSSASDSHKIGEPGDAQKDVAMFDHIGLLGDILGDISVSKSVPQSVTPAPPPIIVSAENRGAMSTPSTFSSPFPHPSSSQITLATQSDHVPLSPDSSLPEVLPINMSNPALSRTNTSSTTLGSEDMAGLALLLGDPPDLAKSPTWCDSLSPPSRPITAPSETRVPGLQLSAGSNQHLPFQNVGSSVMGQHDQRANIGHGPSVSIHDTGYSPSGVRQHGQRASISYMPSIQSLSSQNEHPNHKTSLSTLHAFTHPFTHHQNGSSATLPGHFAWANSSSTTVSSLSAGPTGSNLLYKSETWEQPIAELDSSPYQMVPATNPSSHLPCPDGGPRMAKQLNLIPVELSAENAMFPKTTLRRQSGTRRGRSSSTQLRGQPFSNPATENQRAADPEHDSHLSYG